MYLCVYVMCTPMSHESSRGHLLAHWRVHNTETHTNAHTEKKKHRSDLLCQSRSHNMNSPPLEIQRSFVSEVQPLLKSEIQTYFHSHIKKALKVWGRPGSLGSLHITIINIHIKFMENSRFDHFDISFYVPI